MGLYQSQITYWNWRIWDQFHYSSRAYFKIYTSRIFRLRSSTQTQNYPGNTVIYRSCVSTFNFELEPTHFRLLRNFRMRLFPRIRGWFPQEFNFFRIKSNLFNLLSVRRVWRGKMKWWKFKFGPRSKFRSAPRPTPHTPHAPHTLGAWGCGRGRGAWGGAWGVGLTFLRRIVAYFDYYAVLSIFITRLNT